MSDRSTAPPPPRAWMRWGIVVAATLVLAVASGGRFLVGVVFDQIRESFAISHGILGLAVTLNVMIIAATQPLVGWLVDRVPARYVAAGGLAIFGAGLVLTGLSDTVFTLFIGYGLIVGIGLAAVGPVTVTPLVIGWFRRRRATALSIVNAGGSIGQLAIVPALTITVGMIGWRDSYIYLGAGLALIGGPLLLLLLREREEETDGQVSDAGVGCTVHLALRSASFWKLGVGFFACGFTMAWVSTFFVDYALEIGMQRGEAAVGLSVMGGMSIVGAFFMGWWSDRAGRIVPLAVTYLMRGAGFGLLLLAATNVPLMVIAMAIVGLSWTATVPLTSALSADIYGRRNLGTIFGLMFAIMPFGSAVGSAGAGFLHDLTGSYAMSIWTNFAVGIIAGAVVLMVSQSPIFQTRRSRPRTSSVPAD